ncbi:alanine--glyoxylate aminotransferase 1-like [Venturia nashicola]|uniref:alanine--glyoxylate transaminase n=1 Tax=Venturia nashicola TaxID=86259 RepID=A0A4Z1NDM4_9PEZI|nr:alanine--glyoxylate aminotransferase 1-like [Venturia nashicola]
MLARRIVMSMRARTSTPPARLHLLQQHLASPSCLIPHENSSVPTTTPPQARAYSSRTSTAEELSSKMSNQEPHPALLIPGPIEFDDAVLQAMSHYSESHVGMPFVNIFGETLTMLRNLFQTTDPASQPFVISGSGTLGWDQVAANLVEPGEEALVLHTGYFADSFADCFETYGAKVTQLKAPIGDRPQLDAVEKALKEKKYKVITVTHVDTSTGVLSEIKALSELVHKVSPDTLVIVDGVCSVGSEEIAFDDWKIDVVLTASQKGISCPAGLSIVMASGRAIEVFKARKTPPGSYFGSWKNWLPIMQNYEAKKPSYFATPSPQLIRALHTSLTQILSKPLSERFATQKEASQRIKAAVKALGLKQVAEKPENQANGMTAIYLPNGLTPPEILPSLLKKGVVFAGGLHKEIASKYIRFGHMGVSVMDPKRKDVDKAIEALKTGLVEVGYSAPK